MKKKMVMTLVLCCLAGSLAACRGKGTESSPSEAAETSAEGQSQEAGENTDGEIAEGTGEAADSSSPFSDDEMFTDRDYETDYDDVAAEISLDETGASGMGQTFGDSEQAVITHQIEEQIAGTEISIQDPDDNVLISTAPDQSFSMILFSSPDLTAGESYQVTVGGTVFEVTAQ